MPTDNPGATLHLTAGGVSVILDATNGQLPAIVHWGEQLPVLTAEEARTMVGASTPVTGSSTIDVPPRPGLLPGQDSGWMGRPGLRGSFDGIGWSPKFRVHTVALNGAPVTGFASAGAGRVLVSAIDDAQRLRLDLTLELLPGGLMRSRAKLTNLHEKTYAVDDVSLAFPIPAEATELLDFAGSHNFERVPQRGTLRTGTHLRENRKGRTGSDSAFILHAGTPGFGFGSGEVWAVHTAWSGNHHHFAERFFGDQLLGGGELLLPGEVRLGLGDTYRSPWVYASYGTGLDAVARRFHAHVRSRISPVSADRPVTLNVWEAVYFDHEEEKLIDLAERAAAAGVERYVLDDGWFGSRRDDTSGLGDWVVSPDVWPAGLHPLVDRVHELGMQFGLWFEPEMVNPASDVARDHPEWIMAARSDWPVESRSQQVLNLGIPEAYEHVKKQILALLAQNTSWTTSNGTTTGTSSRPETSWRVDVQVCTGRRWRSMRCLRKSVRSIQGWKLSHALPAEPAWTSAFWSTRTGYGCRTTSTPTIGKQCSAGPRNCCRPNTWDHTLHQAVPTPLVANTT